MNTQNATLNPNYNRAMMLQTILTGLVLDKSSVICDIGRCPVKSADQLRIVGETLEFHLNGTNVEWAAVLEVTIKHRAEIENIPYVAPTPTPEPEVIAAPASVKPTVPDAKSHYQEQWHTGRVLALVYANQPPADGGRWRPGYFFKLDTCEPLRIADPQAAIERLTGAPLPDGAFWQTHLSDYQPRKCLRPIGWVWVDVEADTLRSILRKLDQNATAAELAQDLRTLRQAEVGVERTGIVPEHVSEAMERMGE